MDSIVWFMFEFIQVEIYIRVFRKLLHISHSCFITLYPLIAYIKSVSRLVSFLVVTPFSYLYYCSLHGNGPSIRSHDLGWFLGATSNTQTYANGSVSTHTFTNIALGHPSCCRKMLPRNQK